MIKYHAIIITKSLSLKCDVNQLLIDNFTIKYKTRKGSDVMSNRILRFIYIVIGSISLALGVLGIFLPILPTTPFLLLSAFCYVRGSKRLYLWLLNHKYFGPYIKAYYEKKGITRKTKIVAITTLWLSILICVSFFLNQWYLRVMLLTIASIVTVYICKQKTLESLDEKSLEDKHKQNLAPHPVK